jgi:membrane-associated phospholipid phosphatase
VSPRRAALALAAGYAGLAVLVATGVLTAVDQWSVDHLMASVPGPGGAPSIVDAAIPLRHSSWHTGIDAVANVVTVPAQALIASALAGLCCLVLWRRGRARAAVAFGGIWLAGAAVELLCKTVLERPLLHAGGYDLIAFQSSYPSGHTLRSLLLVAGVAAVWPAARRWVGLWAAATIVLLVVAGFHVPSDIVGGLLLALLLIVMSRAASREAG